MHDDCERLHCVHSWMRWHCPPDTGFEIRVMVVWGRARYLSVTEAPHNTEYLRVSGKETFCFFETWMTEWGSNPRSPTFLAEAALTTDVVSTSQQRHVPSGLALLCEQAWQASRTKINEMNRALGTNNLIWAMRTFWWWLGEWDDTVLQTQDSKLKHLLNLT